MKGTSVYENEYCVNGTLPFRKIGGSMKYSKSEIEKMMNRKLNLG